MEPERVVRLAPIDYLVMALCSGAALGCPSELAQTFWTAIAAFTTCLIASFAVSVVTRPRAREELRGLVHSLTARTADEVRSWRRRATPPQPA